MKSFAGAFEFRERPALLGAMPMPGLLKQLLGSYKAVGAVLLAGELVLSLLIVWKVRFTEIDWDAYVQVLPLSPPRAPLAVPSRASRAAGIPVPSHLLLGPRRWRECWSTAITTTPTSAAGPARW